MKTTFSVLLLLAFLSFGNMLRAEHTPPSNYLVSYELKYSYSKDSLDRFWKSSAIPQMVVPVRNAVDMYEVTTKAFG